MSTDMECKLRPSCYNADMPLWFKRIEREPPKFVIPVRVWAGVQEILSPYIVNHTPAVFLRLSKQA